MPTIKIGNNSTDDYSGFQDTRMRSAQPYNNYGGETAGYVGKYAAGNWEYSLFRPTGISSIPAGSIITAVKLYVYVQDQIGSVSHVWTLRECKRAWVEGTREGSSNWYEVCWSWYNDGDTGLWQTGGGIGNNDRDNDSSLGTISFGTTTGYKSCEGNSNFVQLVQDWLDGYKTNNGIHAERTDAENDETAKQIVWSGGTDGRRPYLEVTYTEDSVTYTVTYNGNNNTSGTAPTDSNSPYDSGATVTTLTNSGSLARTNYTFNGWNTAADKSGTHYNTGATFTISANTTLYAEWTATYQYRTIDHTNYDPSDYTDAEIAYAAMKKVYFEHASTGQDIVGDSDADSSTGNNYDDSDDCGLALLYAEDSRYLCDRDSHESGNDYTWFSTHGGLQDNHRGNPTPANKIGGFVGLSANMCGAVEIAMFKYCWIDVWSETSGYISDGAAAAASDIEDIEAFEAANTGVTVVWWTMPLQDDASYAAREAYNDAIRTYCLDHGKWLLDIADIECHNASGVKQVDGNNREIATTAYMRDDGGHLGDTGRLRLAQAYWSLIAAIANDGGSATYTVSGVTYNKSGSILGGCTVSLFKHTGSGVFSYVGTTTSNASTGAYSITTADNDAAYMVVAFKADTPHVFDVSDYNLQPEFTEP